MYELYSSSAGTTSVYRHKQVYRCKQCRHNAYRLYIQHAVVTPSLSYNSLAHRTTWLRSDLAHYCLHISSFSYDRDFSLRYFIPSHMIWNQLWFGPPSVTPVSDSGSHFLSSPCGEALGSEELGHPVRP